MQTSLYTKVITTYKLMAQESYNSPSQTSQNRITMQTWQLQEAKARLSELVKRAATEGPQEITVRGESAAIIVSRADFEKLKLQQAPKPSLVELLQSSPFMGLDIEFERDKSLPREISFDE